MIRRLRSLRADRRGVSLVEFALALPLVLSLIIGTVQMGVLYFAHAGLRNLVAEGARYASISPRPTEAAIKARLEKGSFGLDPDKLGTPTVTFGKAADGSDFATVTMSYEMELNFVFWEMEPFQLQESRQVFIYPETAAEVEAETEAEAEPEVTPEPA